MRGPDSFWNRPLTFVLLLVLAFAGGVLADRQGLLPGSVPAPRGLGRTFAEAWHLVDKYYVDRSAVQPEAMTRGAIEGMLTSLGDTGHTTYLTPEEVKRMDSALTGEFDGIGARVSVRNHRPTIAGTIPGSPARAAGLDAGDVLEQVDGKDVAELSLERVVDLVRGKPGTTVHLQVLRPGRSKPLEFDIERAKVEVPSVSWHMLPGVPVAHLAIESFGEHTDAEVKSAVAEARKQGARGLLLDVRGDPGGLKKQAVAVTSEFLKGGLVFIEQNAEGQRQEIPVLPGGVATDIPVTVLIDEGTASSAEIFAGALQDHKRGKLVGTHTFGTGTVLEEFPLSDGSAVLLAVAEWLTPSGQVIWHKGIQPDVVVTLPEDAKILLPEEEDKLTASELAKSSDKQLLKALELLKEEIGLPGKS
jgi:carboxyl-terminal processing protease